VFLILRYGKDAIKLQNHLGVSQSPESVSKAVFPPKHDRQFGLLMPVNKPPVSPHALAPPESMVAYGLHESGLAGVHRTDALEKAEITPPQSKRSRTTLVPIAKEESEVW
jgi:hypothetical protein